MIRFMRNAFFALALVACTSGGAGPIGGDGGTTSSSGSSSTSSGDVTPANPQAILQVGGGPKVCEGLPGLQVGQFGNAETGTPANPIANGSSVSVTCRVAPNGSSFAVSTTIVAGTTTFGMTAQVDASGAASNGKLELKDDAENWTSSACTLTATSAQMGVAPGRFWTTFSCPDATSNGSAPCAVSGELRIENCAQD